MCSISSFVILLILMNYRLSFSEDVAINENEEIIKLYHETRARNREHKCKLPQPRSITIKDLLISNKLQLDNCEIAVPRTSFMHVCDFGTGCCDKYSTCQPEIIEEVKLAFNVIRKPLKYCSKMHNIPRSRYISVKAFNHTLCSCQSL